MLSPNAQQLLKQVHEGPSDGWQTIGNASVFTNLKNQTPHGLQCSAHVLTQDSKLYLFLFREQEGREFFAYLYTPYYLGPGTYKGAADDISVFVGWTVNGQLENWKADAESYSELTTYVTKAPYWVGDFNCKGLKVWDGAGGKSETLPDLEIQFAFFDESEEVGK